MKKATTLILALCALCATAQQTETVYLSGRGCDDTATWGFTVTDGMRAGRKATIEVPSCWEQQGYGDYTYGRWYTRKGEQPSTEEGRYTHTFSVPAHWRGKKVEINFEGVMTDATVWVNGQQAGPTHQGAFTAFSYDISDKVRYGKSNRLEVLVQKESADKSINAAERKADWWLFGGIYRPVYLTAKPARHIDWATVDARADGTVTIRLKTGGSSGGRMSLRAGISPVGTSRVAYGPEELIALPEPVPAGDLSEETAPVDVTISCTGVSLWDPEHPNLYDLTLTLVDEHGAPAHQITKRIGFRTVEFRPSDGFYLNGRKLLIKGVNRHCFYPETGRATSHARDLADVKLIKDMNANAIRSHYPPDAHLLDICDSLGVLYLDELAGWQNAYSTEQGSRILSEMVRHDASHPCVFAWSNGNEGGFNYELDSQFALHDPQERHVVHAWALWDGVDTHHYPAYQTGVDRLQYGQEVFMPTEFLHAQYDKGAGASLKDFWRNWTQSPLFAGGFIWAWVDEGVERRDRGNEIDTDGPNGPDGIVGPYREREGSWYAIREVWSPIQIDPVRVNSLWDGTLVVSNHLQHSTLDECRLYCGDTEVALPPIKPREAAVVTVPRVYDRDSILRLTALSGEGDTLCQWAYPSLTAAEYFGKLVEPRLQGGAQKPELTFDSATGLLSKVTVGGREIPFAHGPQPVGFKMELKEFGGDGDRYVARYTGGVDSIVWEVHENGLVSMDAVLLNSKNGHGHKGPFVEEKARTFGFSFDYPEALCSGMSWLGKGPYRVWRNRQEGQTLGRWQKDYNNTVTGEPAPGRPLVYPEFKGYHGQVYWATLESESCPVTVYSETDGLYLRVYTPEEPERRRDGKPTMEAFPPGDISFLIDIAPIQSYKPLEQLGPEAMVPTVRINQGDQGIRMKLWFDFSGAPAAVAE